MDYSTPFSAPVFSFTPKGGKDLLLTQKGFEDFQNQGPCISPLVLIQS